MYVAPPTVRERWERRGPSKTRMEMTEPIMAVHGTGNGRAVVHSKLIKCLQATAAGRVHTCTYV